MKRLPSIEFTGTGPKWQDQVRDKRCLKHDSLRTQPLYIDRGKQFIRHFGNGYSAGMVLREC
jgi:hypothetical protein